MGKTARNIKGSLINLNPLFFTRLLSISPLNSLVISPRKNSRNQKNHCSSANLTLVFFLSLFILCTFLGISILTFIPISQNSIPCSMISPSSPLSPFLLASLSSIAKDYSNNFPDDEPTLSTSAMVPLPPHGFYGNLSEEEREFWQQPDGEGYHPCLDFSLEYRKSSVRISKQRRKFLVVVVSGGLNQQRNQIVDAVVIARVLEAALVVPVLQVNRIWGDESEFSDIFDVEHFKKTLQADVRIVTSLPSTHLVAKQSVENQIPFHVSPTWIRARFLQQ
ncbi:O-fucosyltransferase 37-like, partial [Olea europaea var. sylvestris]|uniref:O-fucosyltransferase 37-like n=1 Tax=Olea europaea var. sylvestris TaxID=158386 RepID=UPI000C1CE9AC